MENALHRVELPLVFGRIIAADGRFPGRLEPLKHAVAAHVTRGELAQLLDQARSLARPNNPRGAGQQRRTAEAAIAALEAAALFHDGRRCGDCQHWRLEQPFCQLRGGCLLAGVRSEAEQFRLRGSVAHLATRYVRQTRSTDGCAAGFTPRTIPATLSQ